MQRSSVCYRDQGDGKCLERLVVSRASATCSRLFSLGHRQQVTTGRVQKRSLLIVAVDRRVHEWRPRIYDRCPKAGSMTGRSSSGGGSAIRWLPLLLPHRVVLAVLPRPDSLTCSACCAFPLSARQPILLYSGEISKHLLAKVRARNVLISYIYHIGFPIGLSEL